MQIVLKMAKVWDPLIFVAILWQKPRDLTSNFRGDNQSAYSFSPWTAWPPKSKGVADQKSICSRFFLTAFDRTAPVSQGPCAKCKGRSVAWFGDSLWDVCYASDDDTMAGIDSQNSFKKTMYKIEFKNVMYCNIFCHDRYSWNWFLNSADFIIPCGSVRTAPKVFRLNHNIGSHCLCDLMQLPGTGSMKALKVCSDSLYAIGQLKSCFRVLV